MRARTLTRTLLLALAAVAGRPATAAPPDDPPSPANAKRAPKEAVPSPAERGAPPPVDPEATKPVEFIYNTDEAIALFRRRAERNPANHAVLTTLGDLYERKARETDDLTYYARAEDVLRRAVALAPKYRRARVTLATVLCDRHKFAEGLALAREVARADPKDVDALVTIGDALIELGRYGEAEAAYRALARQLPGPPSDARLAHLAEMRGQTDEALERLRRALAAMEKLGETAENTAWYRVRLADLLFDGGELSEPEALYQDVLKRVPKHHDATAGLAKVRAAQGRYDEAVALYEKAVAIAPDPVMIGILGDLYARAGDEARARACYDRVERATADWAEYRRVRCLFDCDHDRDLPRALELARQDVAERQDAGGYDALAWALLKNDRPDEASRAIAAALKVGTKDARIDYHAGLIYRRLGDREQARQHLRRALARNPHFSVRQAEEARKALAELDAEPKAGQAPAAK